MTREHDPDPGDDLELNEETLEDLEDLDETVRGGRPPTGVGCMLDGPGPITKAVSEIARC